MLYVASNSHWKIYQLVGGPQEQSYGMKITKNDRYQLGQMTDKCFGCDWQMEDNSIPPSNEKAK